MRWLLISRENKTADAFPDLPPMVIAQIKRH